MRKIYFLFFITLTVILTFNATGQIVAWNNNSLSGVTAGSINATTNNANLNTSVLSRGSGITATSLTGGYASSNWIDANQSDAITNNRYYQCIISANSGFKVSLSTLDCKLRRTATGPNAYIWRYSTDGVNFTDIGSPVSFTSTTATGDVQPQINLAGIAALQNVLSGITITLRLYAWGGTAAGGTLAFGTGNVNSLAFGGTVDAGASSLPTLTVSPNTLNFPATPVSTSTTLTYTLTGTDLTNDVTVSTSSPYTVSVDNVIFSSSVNILKTDPALASGKTIYVKFTPASVGIFSSSVNNSSTNATTKTVALNGNGLGLINLLSSPYVQNFNSIGTGLPSGITVKTGATASSLGTDAAFTTAPALWNNTSGGFKNFASGNNDPGVTQNTATDRALGVRQVAATDPGVGFVFQIANTTGKINFALDFNLQSLDASSPRVTTWRVDYGFGINPVSFIVPSTTGILTTGGNSFTNNPIHVDFGNALDNQSGIVTIRIVALTGSSGSGNRASTGIDDFTLTWEDPSAKTISLSTAAISFPTINIGTSHTMNYKIVSQTNLDHPIDITASAPYLISTDNVNFFSNLSVNPADAFNKTIYVKFPPLTAGVYPGSIVHSSEGAVSKTISLSGEAIDPAALSFDFNTCTVSSIPGSGFLSINITGAQKWGCSSFGRNGTNGVSVNGFSAGAAQTNDAWLISPALNLNGIVNIPVLSFYSRGEFTGPKLQLYASTTYTGSGVPNPADWTELNGNFPTPPGAATTNWTLSDNIDLSAYKSAPKVYLAFRYTSSPALNAARWSVDDIAITDQSTLLTVSPVQLSFGEISVGTNSASQPVSFRAVGDEDVTITPPSNFQISTDNSTFTTNPIVVSKAAAAAGITLYVRFSPIVKALKIDGNIHVSAPGLSKDIVAVTGSSFPKSETLDVACYNMSFFGSNSTNSATPDQIATQIANITTVYQHLNMDVVGVEEISNDAALSQLISNLPGYASVVSNRWSYSFNPPDPSFPPQKIGFIYNTSTMTLSTDEPPRVMFESMYDSARLNLPGHRLTDYPTGTPSSFWASGRLPFMATFNASVNGVTKKIRVIVVHAKSGADAASYTRRLYDAKVLKDSIDAFYANDKVIILGDYNDRMVTSIYSGHTSSYLPIVNDIERYNILTLPLDQAGRASFPGDAGMIDHITILKNLDCEYISNSTDIEDARQYIPGYGAGIASDHLPVYSRFLLQPPAITSCPTVSPFCKSSDNTYTIPEFTATSPCGIISSYSYSISGATSRNGNTNNASGIFNVGTSTITWTATDGFGNTSTCQTTVTVYANPTVSIPDAYAMSSGVLPNTVYIGYAPASSITLTSNVSGGSPNYVYSWSNGSVAASTTVNPVVNTTYTLTVTDANGCSGTANKNIKVIDLRGGNKLDKVVICHKGSTVTVDGSAVPAHLSHGDMLADCMYSIPTVTHNSVDRIMENSVPALSLNALPNPSSTDFTLTISGLNSYQKISLRVTDISGRILEQKENIQALSTIKVGQNYRPGVYIVELIQGNEKRMLKLIKMNN
jgi:hypothetical protein